MKSILRNLPGAVMCLALGVGVYYAQDGWRSTRRNPANERGPNGTRVTIVDAVSGAQLLAATQLAVDQPATLIADIELSGVVDGQSTSLTGQYQQQGRGEGRRFCWTLRGRIGGSPLRLWQVSVQDILWTDLAWNGDGPDARHQVERIDLARLRAEFAPAGDMEVIDPGQARAAFARPELWPTQGGLPALLDGLHRAFEFAPPALMRMRGQPVYALIGKPLARAERDSMAPDHVLLVVDATLRLPLLIEYRGADDPLSDQGLADADRLIESPSPLFKLRIVKPRLEAPVDAERFNYSPPPNVAWTDRTETRLQNLRMAAQPSPSNGSH